MSHAPPDQPSLGRDDAAQMPAAADDDDLAGPSTTGATTRTTPTPIPHALSRSPPPQGLEVSHDAITATAAGADDGDNGDVASDTDSAYDGASAGDDTETLSSNVTNYRHENGRRYHSFPTSAYWGPNDESAAETQDLSHRMYLLTLDGKLHLAPVDETALHRILDVGTGTGLWAIEAADKYPGAKVIGCDLSPEQPQFVPPNCWFEVDDLTLEWTWDEGYFDFIHVREMFGSIPDWDGFFAQCRRCVRPGGWVEVMEHGVEPMADDGSMGEDHFYRLWGATVVEMGARLGRSFTIYKEAKERMVRAGFEEVHEERFVWPMNAWSGQDDEKLRRLGELNQQRLHQGVEGMMLRLLTQAGGWSVERAQVHLWEMRRALKDVDCHAYVEGTVVYGRRPLD